VWEGGGHTLGFRQNTIPDRREFDKHGIQVTGNRLAGFYIPGAFDAPSRLKGGDLDKKWLSLGWGFRHQTF